jgi:hypothetical protein
MKKFPTVITSEILMHNTHLPDERLEQDISDTNAEILGYKATMDAEQKIAQMHPDPQQRKLAAFRASARPQQIREREEFVTFVTRLLEARRAARN